MIADKIGGLHQDELLQHLLPVQPRVGGPHLDEFLQLLLPAQPQVGVILMVKVLHNLKQRNSNRHRHQVALLN